MNYPNPYFKNIPNVGNLSIDYVFFEIECPLLFTCKDINENLYLCICCEISAEQRWIISPISSDNLISMIDNKLSLFDAFKADNEIYVAHWKSGYEKERIETRSFSEIDLCDIPEEGEFLDAEDGEYNDYLEILNTRPRLLYQFKSAWNLMTISIKPLQIVYVSQQISDTKGGYLTWQDNISKSMLLVN